MKPIGFIELFYIVDGEWNKISEFKNSTLYQGGDILARALAGDTDYIVNGMYLEYMNGSPGEPTISLDRDYTYYTSLSSPNGFARVNTVSEPSYSATGSDYEGNKVTFTAVADASDSFGGASIIDGTTQFFSMALVAMPDADDITKDKIYSAAAITRNGVFAPISKIANAQFGLRWSTRFEV